MAEGVRAGTLSVHLNHRRLDPVVNRLVLGLLTSSLLLGSSLLWSLKAQPVVAGVSVFGAIGYAAACFLAVTLFRDIRSSERPREDSRTATAPVIATRHLPLSRHAGRVTPRQRPRIILEIKLEECL